MIPKHDKDGRPLVKNSEGTWILPAEKTRPLDKAIADVKKAIAKVERQKEAQRAIKKSKRKGKRK